MSTILDALRKVERERDPAAEPALDGPTISPETRRRRPFPIAAIVLCAVVGFGGGALLSWLTSEPAIEIAELPVPPPPPEIDVPRAPTRGKPAEPGAPPAAVVAGAEEAEKAAAPEVDVAAAPSGAPLAVAPPPAEGIAPRAEVPPPATRDAAPPAEMARPAPPDAPALAAVDRGSALEPSPFGPARDNVPARDSVAREVAPPVKPAPADPALVVPSEEEIAALAPRMAPAEPHLEEAPEEEPAPEPESETPAEVLFDTGRSPPGAPKVALSFLQWSSDPSRRFAFISIDGAPTQRVHEGEVTAGLTVAAITPTGVQFKREGTVFVIRPRH